MFCIACGAPVPEKAAFCPSCGAKIAGEQSAQTPAPKKELRRLTCTSCGSNSLRQIRKGEYRCEHCGSRLLVDEDDSAESAEETNARLMEILGEAEAYMEKGAYQDELRVLTKGLEIKADDGNLLLRLGRCYWRLGITQKALEYYRRAEELYPNDPIVYSNIGSLYISQKEYELAKPQYEKSIAMIEADPLSATAGDIAVTYGNYALCIGELGDKAGAKKYLRLAKKRGYSKNSIEIICKRVKLRTWEI